MYKRKKSERQYRRNRRIGLWLTALFMTFTAVGIYAFTSMLAFAATENPAVEALKEAQKPQEERKVSGKKLPSEKSNVKKTEKSDIPLIVIDAGHGGVDDGCLGAGVFEKDINLQIALHVQNELEAKGFQVMMLRESDEYLAVEERVELANSYQADAYISIHQNTYEGTDKSVSGIEVWYDGADDTRDNERLAKLVHQETVKSTGANERELWDIADYCVTNKTLMPACLIETGFLSNPEECRRLALPKYQEKIAEGIAEGIDLYFHPRTIRS